MLSARVILVVILACASDSLAISHDESHVFGTVREGYLANRRSFTRFTCKFNWNSGTAVDLHAALAGEIDVEVAHAGLWIVDEPNVRYELLCDPKVLEPAISRMRSGQDRNRSRGTSISILPCASRFYLKNAEIIAHQSKTISSVNLLTTDRFDAGGVDVTPISLGIMAADEFSSPDNYLTSVLDGRFVGKVEGPADVLGATTIEISAGKPREGKPNRMHFFFDPNRAFLPVKITDTDPDTGRIRLEAYYTDFRNCGSGRWFPMRGLVIKGGGPGGRVIVRETKVIEFDLDQADKSEFYLDIPAGTQVTIVNSPYHVNIDENEHVAVDQLESLRQRCIKHGEERIERENAMKAGIAGTAITADARGSNLPFIVGINVAIAITIALAVYARKLRAKSNP